MYTNIHVHVYSTLARTPYKTNMHVETATQCGSPKTVILNAHMTHPPSSLLPSSHPPLSRGQHFTCGGGTGGGEEESVDRAGDKRPHQEPQPRALETDPSHSSLPQRQQPTGTGLL